MVGRGLTFGAVWALVLAGPAVGAEPSPTAPDPAALEFFEAKVRPVLVNRCGSCHGAEKSKAGLRLDSREAVLGGGDSGPAAVAGKPGESLIIEAINYGETVQMPPKSRLPAAEVEALTRWVEMGLPWPGGGAAKPAAAGGAKPGFDLKARRDAHWAWKPVEAHDPPDVRDASWPLDPVDRFVLARLDAKGLKPAPETGRRAFARRAAFDLTGLPPTPAEVEAFVNDRAPDAYERLVDRLLASPRFGERWGRHWLDLVRYGETRGHEYDPAIPNAWQYRDYVVRAFNADVPYDQFLTEHIAGDLLERPRVDPKTGANESVLGTGFFLLGEEVHSPVDVRADETDRMDNRVDVMTKTFLGLTVACARCHDHKFDAISQRDYYALSGFLIGSPYRQVRFATAERERETAEALRGLRDGARARVLALAARGARAGVDRLADDLLDARAMALGCACNDRKRGTDPDPARFRRWADELAAAKSDPSHPLHPFAVAACSESRGDARPFAERVRGLAGARTGADGLARYDLESVRGRVVADFGALDSLARFQDGFAFGLRPVRPGDLVPGGDGPPAPAGLVTTAAARRDPAFRHLDLAPGVQRDYGRLGGWERAGQTLRTPEVTLGSGRLWYLARGAGRVYAAVNSHLMIAGPLHGALLTEWTDGQKGWRWVHHDLTAYAGHRAHIEFSPSGASELEVAAVVEADREPPPVSRPDDPLAAALTAPGVDSPEALARAYQAQFSDVVRRMEADALGGPGASEGLARLADWVVRRPELFGGEELRAAVAEEFGRLRGAEESLARQVAVAAPAAPALSDGNGVNERLLIRGSSKTPGPEVPRRFLEALVGGGPIEPLANGGTGRQALAEQMLAPSNPFTRRVIVNRVWHHLFGRGIVASVDNFGVLGETPTHPELLDHLADRFVRDGWSVKRLVRALVLTRAYRMSSRPDPEADRVDPDNRLWHRASVRRLQAEPIRDAMLAVSGRLDGAMAGPSVPVHLTPYMQGRGRPTTDGPVDGAGRRSLYLEIRRNFLAPMMLAFDAPIPFSTMGRRNVSNVPAQALMLMNDPFVVGQARLWADRVLAGDTRSPADRVAAMYLAAFSRPPAPKETADALAFLESQGRELGLKPGAWENDRRAWGDLAHVLFNAKEFVFLE